MQTPINLLPLNSCPDHARSFSVCSQSGAHVITDQPLAQFSRQRSLNRPRLNKATLYNGF